MRKIKQYLLGLGVLTVLTLGLGASLFAAFQDQDLRQQARVMEGPGGGGADPAPSPDEAGCITEVGYLGPNRESRVGGCGAGGCGATQRPTFTCNGTNVSVSCNEAGECASQDPQETVVTCYDKNQGCLQVAIPQSQCTAGNAKYGSQNECYASLDPVSIGWNQTCQADPGRKCTCPNGQEVDRAQSCPQDPALDVCPASYTETQPSCTANQTLQETTLQSGKLCYTCVAKPSVNCYDLNQGCVVITLYADASPSCDEVTTFSTSAACLAQQAAQNQVTCWYFDGNTCVTTPVTGSCSIPEGTAPPYDLYDSAGICLSNNQTVADTFTTISCFDAFANCSIISLSTQDAESCGEARSNNTSRGAYDTLSQCQNNKPNAPLPGGRECTSDNGCLCSDGANADQIIQKGQTCQPRKADGQPCTQGKECQAGSCVQSQTNPGRTVCGRPQASAPAPSPLPNLDILYKPKGTYKQINQVRSLLEALGLTVCTNPDGCTVYGSTL